jgi:hypothetical protein
MEVDVVLAGATMTYHSLPMARSFRRVSDTILIARWKPPARNVQATSTSPNSLRRHRNALQPPH